MQSHLLKLEPPYQIIACRGEIGVQIGTLIVMEETCGDDGKYGIIPKLTNIQSLFIAWLTEKALFGIKWNAMSV